MSISEARVPTASARRYMGQMWGHFGHRRPAATEGDTGRIGFEGGDCLMRAEADALVLRIEAVDDASRERLEAVAARHLERFMFRETPTVEWRVADSVADSAAEA